MLILSLDSAGSSCGVCVWRDGNVLAEAEEYMERGQDQRLMPLIMEIMAKAGVTFEQLDRIAVTRGPGSFTGLRIGLAAARGIGLAANKPVIGIDRFAVFRAAFNEPGKNLLVVINSKRKELYCRFYPANGQPDAPAMLDTTELREFLDRHSNTFVTGDMTFSDFNMLPKMEIAETVLCAALAAKTSSDDPAFLPRPLYIRSPDVTMKATEITFRPVTPDMAETLIAIHAQGFGNEAWNHGQMLGSLSLPTTQGWVAFDKNNPVGFILFQAVPDEQEILTFAVAQDYRRRKIGEKLLQKMIDAAHASKVGTIFLDVAADNIAATKLYEKTGFVLAGKRPDYYKYSNKTVDGLLFKLNLTVD